jgi:hypothetical protein
MPSSTEGRVPERRRRRRPALQRAVTATVLAAMLSLPVLAGGLTLRVAEPLGPVAPGAITGFNVTAAPPVVLHMTEYGAMDIGSLRFPPGNDADDYVLTADTLGAFAQTWRILGEPDVHLVANFFEGPEHALAVAATLRELGIAPRWWAVGNEPDLYPRNRMDPAWTAEVYCERFRAMRSVLEAELGDVRMSGPAVSGSRPSGLDYLREVITRCGDVIDLVTWHVYPTDGTRSDDDALATSRELTGEIAQVRAWLADPTVNPLGYEREVEIGVTEFGLSWRTQMLRHLEDQVAAVWLAEALGQLATHGVDVSQYFALYGLGGHGLIDRTGWVRPTYHVYAMLACFAGTAHRVDGGDERLAAYAAADDTALRVLIVNRSDEPIDVTLQADGLAAVLDVATLDEPTFDETLAPRRSVHDASVPLLAPPRSVVVVHSPR